MGNTGGTRTWMKEARESIGTIYLVKTGGSVHREMEGDT